MPPGLRSMLLAGLGGFVLCSSLYTIVYPGFQSACFPSTPSTTPTATTATAEVSKDYMDEEPACTPQEGSYQASNYCSIFMGRHNLKPFFTLLRFHLPDVKLLVDIGANKGLVSSRWLELWRPELNQTARQHVNFVMQYVKDNAPADTWDRWCGVTDMCDQPNLIERAMLDEYAPVTKHTSSSNQHKRVI